MQFQLCENVGFFLRLGLAGPAGSGKTYTALAIATELGFEKIGVIDTENRSARRYAKSFGRRFHSLELDHFSPRDYIEAIRAAEAAGIEVLIIDSLSHAWMGKGGVLEMVDHSARRQAKGGTPNSFSGWREVTPEHNRLVEALIHAKMHLIVTLRVKTEYVVEEDGRGKKVPRKVGLAPVQREGLEYEFDVVGDITMEHELLITKSRCSALSDAVIRKPGEEMAKTLREWLDGVDSQGDEAQPPIEGATRIYEEEMRVIDPWLKRIEEARESGDEAQLDAVRTEMNSVLKQRTKAQGEALRKAIESVRSAIRAAVRNAN